jgi:hypothetical protein
MILKMFFFLLSLGTLSVAHAQLESGSFYFSCRIQKEDSSWEKKYGAFIPITDADKIQFSRDLYFLRNSKCYSVSVRLGHPSGYEGFLKYWYLVAIGSGEAGSLKLPRQLPNDRLNGLANTGGLVYPYSVSEVFEKAPSSSSYPSLTFHYHFPDASNQYEGNLECSMSQLNFSPSTIDEDYVRECGPN